MTTAQKAATEILRQNCFITRCLMAVVRMPLQAEEALGPIFIPRGSRGFGPFQRTSASRTEKPGAYSTSGTPSGRGVFLFVLFPL